MLLWYKFNDRRDKILSSTITTRKWDIFMQSKNETLLVQRIVGKPRKTFRRTIEKKMARPGQIGRDLSVPTFHRKLGRKRAYVGGCPNFQRNDDGLLNVSSILFTNLIHRAQVLSKPALQVIKFPSIYFQISKYACDEWTKWVYRTQSGKVLCLLFIENNRTVGIVYMKT